MTRFTKVQINNKPLTRGILETLQNIQIISRRIHEQTIPISAPPNRVQSCRSAVSIYTNLQLILSKFFRTVLHPRDVHEPANLERCYQLLTKTSRSFAAVIMELNPELRVAIMLFYLILRALDTVEDDMTIAAEVKVPLLRDFHSKLKLEKWNFTGNAPTEKDRIVLVEFDKILKQYHQLKPEYQDIIMDITDKMGNGMADYIGNDQFNLEGVETVKDYDLYCHYVAGLVGEGLTKLIVAAQFGDPSLEEKMYLSESMGLFLQKTNIIRDYKEDLDDGRSFWPKEIWSKHVNVYADMAKEAYLEEALNCTSELVLNALAHVKHVLMYLSLVHDSSAYQFCVIPQVMAIATLCEVFQNPLVFKKNVKIRKGTTCKLILESRTFEGCCDIFKNYINAIHHKCPVADANYLKIGIMCGEIIQFIEELFPVNLPSNIEPPQTEYYLNCVKRCKYDEELKPDLLKENVKCNVALMSVGAVLLVSVYYLVN